MFTQRSLLWRQLYRSAEWSRRFSTAADLKQLCPASLVSGDGGESTSESSLAKYNVDWLSKYIGSSSIVVRPKSTAEVSAALAYCNEHRIPVVPQG
jgi:FAD/FMN-containing dehydrogenase